MTTATNTALLGRESVAVFDEEVAHEPRSARLYSFFIAMYAALLVVSNIVAVKLASTPFGIVSASIICFPLTYAISNILTEVYGYALARRAVWVGFSCNLVAVMFVFLVGAMTPAPFWKDQSAYDAILGLSPRIVLWSFVAVLVGSFVNDFIVSRLKIVTEGKHMWGRFIGGTAVGEGLDSVLFYTGAFFGVLPFEAIIAGIGLQWGMKIVYQAVLTPLTYPIVNWMKELEGYDWYDHGADYNPFHM